MKTYLLTLAAMIFLGSTNSFADEPWREDYGPVSRDPVTTQGRSDLQWLYEKLLPADLRTQSPVEVRRTFEVHLSDTYQKFPDPEMIRQDQLAEPHPIRGMITYVGIFQKSYKYDVFAEPGTAENPAQTLVFNIKIHLQNPTPEDEIAFSEWVQKAEEIWNKSALKTDFQYRFHFELVKARADAHFSVDIQNSTRGPYDTHWSRDWDPNVVAHEIGHMMGLGDEYQPFGKAFGCYMGSLMCSASHGVPLPHHYYFILRRLLR